MIRKEDFVCYTLLIMIERNRQPERTFGFSYLNRLRERFDSADPNDRPAELASFVLQAPTTNEEWQTSGYRGERVSAVGFSDFYSNVVVVAFDIAARDPETARQFLSELDAHAEETRARLHPNDTIDDSRSSFNRPEWQIDPAAFDPLSQKDSLRPQPLLIGSSPLQEYPLLQTIITRLGNMSEQTNPEAVAAIVDWCTPRLPKSRSERERERREARYAESRQTYPGLVDKLTVESVADLDPDRIRELTFPSRTFLTATAQQRIPERRIAETIRDRAESLKLEGLQRVYSAESFNDFWNHLQEFEDLYGEQNPIEKRYTYEQWKQTFIEEQKEQMARRTLEQENLPVDPEAFLPEGVCVLQVQPYDSSITYTFSEIEGLITNLQRFCTPETLTDQSSFLTNRINESMAEEIRKINCSNRIVWDVPLRDYGFELLKDQFGNCRLSLYNDKSEQGLSIEDFAAFTGKEFSADAVAVSYIGSPPEELAVSDGVVEVGMHVPIAAISEHIALYAQLTPTNRSTLTEDVLTEMRKGAPSSGFGTENGGVVQVMGSPVAQRGSILYMPGDDKIDYSARVETVEGIVTLPRVSLSYFDGNTPRNPDVIKAYGVLYAMGVLSDTSERTNALREEGIFFKYNWRVKV
jgi:hypothetical protein